MKRQFILILIAICAFNYQSKAQLCYNAPNYYTVGVNPTNVINDDFNNDGILDLIVVNNSSSDFNVLIGIGTGSFNPATTFTLPGAPGQAVTGDFNGDSNKDIAIAGGSNNLWLLLGTGTGSFNPATNFSTGMFPVGICKSDFNNDGNLDVAIGNGNVANSISVLLGTGTGSFSAATFFTVGTCPCGFAVASNDFNNDGNMDIVTANQTSNDVSLLLGTGTGSFLPMVNFSVGSEPWCIISSDFNNDGNRDVVVSNRVSNNVSVLIGTGTGSFAPVVNYTVGNTPTSVFSADFNNDGKLDLVTADRNSNEISVLVATTPGVFSAPQQFTVSNQPFSVYGGDYNNDNKTDIAVANFQSNNVAVFLNAIPSLSIISTNTLYCSGKNATLTANGATNYTWNPGAIISSSVIISPTSNIVYMLSGSTGSCTNNKSYTISVSPNPTVTALSNRTLICVGESATLTASGAVNYTWNPGAINSSSANISPTITTTYSVVGTNSVGCSTTFTISQTVSPCTSIKELNSSNDLLVAAYPNPSNGLLTISCVTEAKLILTDIFGRIINEIILSPENNYMRNIEIPNSGIYFLISKEGNNVTTKIIVSK